MNKQRKWCTLSMLCVAVLLAVLLSLMYGSRPVSFGKIFSAWYASGIDRYESAIIEARLPRTVFGLLAGAALAVSGSLMQAVTRNPIADPGILGVNTGAALAVVLGMSWFGITSGMQYILFAFAGAMITALAVYGLASLGYEGATPLKLALAGAAASTALQSLVNTVMLPDGQIMDRFRFWQTGSIGGASWADIRVCAPIIVLALVAAFLLSGALNVIALGDEMAAGLGINVPLIRLASTLVGVLLCACTTAMAGPIGFVGLMIPHFIRMLAGPDMRWIIPLSALAGGSALVLFDTLGRLFGAPGELEVGVVTALIGGPVFIGIIRKVKVREA